MAEAQATPEDKLRAIRARLNEAPRDHMLADRQRASLHISDIRWLVHFIDAALLKEDGEDAFDAFAARAAAGHLGALVDDQTAQLAALLKSHQELVEALAELLNDTQHKEHADCEDGYCCVRDARKALANAKELTK